MKGGGFELKGRLKSFDGARYVIDNKVFGTMTLDAANMECIGAGCPGAPARGRVAAGRPPPTCAERRALEHQSACTAPTSSAGS